MSFFRTCSTCKPKQYSPEEVDELYVKSLKEFGVDRAFVELKEGNLNTPANKEKLYGNFEYINGIAKALNAINTPNYGIEEPLNTQSNFDAIIRNAKHAHFLAAGLNKLSVSGKATQANFSALVFGIEILNRKGIATEANITDLALLILRYQHLFSLNGTPNSLFLLRYAEHAHLLLAGLDELFYGGISSEKYLTTLTTGLNNLIKADIIPTEAHMMALTSILIKLFYAGPEINTKENRAKAVNFIQFALEINNEFNLVDFDKVIHKQHKEMWRALLMGTREPTSSCMRIFGTKPSNTESKSELAGKALNDPIADKSVLSIIASFTKP